MQMKFNPAVLLLLTERWLFKNSKSTKRIVSVVKGVQTRLLELMDSHIENTMSGKSSSTTTRLHVARTNRNVANVARQRQL